MDKLLDKISSYNLLNNLMPGSIFCFLLEYICSIDILRESVIENLFIYYFVGVAISRVGSIIIEPIAEKAGIISHVDYNDYIIASKTDKMVETLLETNNQYRTITAGGLSIIVIKLYIIAKQSIKGLSYTTPYFIVFFGLIISLLSLRKQNNYLKKRVNKAIQDTKKEN